MWLHLCFPGKFLNVNMKGWRTSFRVLKFFPLRPLISINPERSNQGSRQQLQPLDRLSDADLGQTRPAARWRPAVVRGGTCAPSRSFRLQRSKNNNRPSLQWKHLVQLQGFQARTSPDPAGLELGQKCAWFCDPVCKIVTDSVIIR